MWDYNTLKFITENDYDYNTKNSNWGGIGIVFKEQKTKDVVIMTSHPNYKMSEEASSAVGGVQPDLAK
jgi:hypothetical protein